MLIKKIETELFADYFQFYIQDESVDGDLSNAWDDDAVNRLLAIAPGTIGIGTVRNMDVPVTISIFDGEPEYIHNLSTIQHVMECDLEVKSKRIVVAGCTDYFPEAMRIDIDKGIYRCRIYYGNLDKLSEDRLDGDDFYELHVWRTEKNKGIIIVKNKNNSN